MIVTVERIEPIEIAFERLRNAPLQATGGREVFSYKNAVMRLADFYPQELNPSTLYIIKERLETQRALRQALLEQYQIDSFRLPGILHLNISGGSFSLAPPFVEVYEETVQIIRREGDRAPPRGIVNVALLVDGSHRAWIAREEKTTIRCAVVRGASREYLQYAYPNAWSDIVICTNPPKNKKHYRRKDPYTFMSPLSVFRGDNPEWNRK